MRRQLGVLPIGTAWRQSNASGVVLEHKPKSVRVFASVYQDCRAPRVMEYADTLSVEVLRDPPFPIPADIQEVILKNG